MSCLTRWGSPRLSCVLSCVCFHMPPSSGERMYQDRQPSRTPRESSLGRTLWRSRSPACRAPHARTRPLARAQSRATAFFRAPARAPALRARATRLQSTHLSLHALRSAHSLHAPSLHAPHSTHTYSTHLAPHKLAPRTSLHTPRSTHPTPRTPPHAPPSTHLPPRTSLHTPQSTYPTPRAGPRLARLVVRARGAQRGGGGAGARRGGAAAPPVQRGRFRDAPPR